MSLSLILSGVEAALPTIGSVVSSAADAVAANIVARSDNDDVTAAIGAGFTPGYTDEFATLVLYEGAARIPLQTFDSVIQDQPTTELDYLIIQTLTEAYVDRMSPNYSFGSSLMYTSGVDARQFVYSGTILADKITGDNIARFRRSYDNALRATQLVTPETPRFVELKYRDQTRRGYLTSFSAQANADFRNKVDFTFTLFVTNIQNNLGI